MVFVSLCAHPLVHNSSTNQQNNHTGHSDFERVLVSVAVGINNSWDIT